MIHRLSHLAPGVKFIVMADSTHQKVGELLAKIYELYSDYVLKNPFYSVDMPIRWGALIGCGAVLLFPVVYILSSIIIVPTLSSFSKKNMSY